MKRIANYLIAMALMAFTFTSCEDVPSPFGQIKLPGAGDDVVTIEPTGSGTQADPFNVAAIIEYVGGLDSDVDTNRDLYVKGIVTNIPEGSNGISASYNNASFYISDDAEGSNSFYVFRCKGLGGGDITDEAFLKVGDEVVIYGTTWVNYKGNTPETKQGQAYIYSINGNTEGGSTKPDTPTEALGTKEAPLTVAKALETINALADGAKSSEDAYVKGIIATVSEIDTGTYGNATYTISDDGTANNAITVFRGLNLGNKKFTAADALKAGDVVVVVGKLQKYVKDGTVTPEMAQGNYIISLNGKTDDGNDTPDTPAPTGDSNGTANSPYSVTAAIAAGSGTGVYVKGYIVGSVSGQVLASGAQFSENSDAATNLLIADSADETNIEKCMPVQLPAGAVRSALNLVDNKGNYKKEVTLYGNIEKYFSATGIKSVTFAILNGNEIGTKPDGGSNTDPTPQPSGSEINVDFKANGQGEWTIANVKALPSGLDYVWAYDSKYGMKATAYVNKVRYETDNWLVSPALNLANGGTMTFKQALNFATSEYVKIMYTTTNGTGDVKSSEWMEATVDTWPAGSDWNFIESKTTLPAGTVRVAFRYTSTTDKAATWEIESLSIK